MGSEQVFFIIVSSNLNGKFYFIEMIKPRNVVDKRKMLNEFTINSIEGTVDSPESRDFPRVKCESV